MAACAQLLWAPLSQLEMAACAQLLSAPLSQLEMAACAQLLSPAWNQLARPPLDSAARAQLPRDSPLHS